MQIFAASAARAAETFLHAGYVSAYPREMYLHPSGEPKLALELTEALRLKGETLASSWTAGDGAGGAASLGGGGPWMPVLLAAAALVSGLVVWLLLRDRVSASGRRWAAAIAGAGSLVAGLACGPGLPTVPPWQGVAVREYADPQQATVMLLNGLVADGIINVRQPIDSLANIQGEVGLPKKALTEGEAYALQTYGLDGWGREMKLVIVEGEEVAYTVKSAGADGIFDSADDLAITVQQADEESWDSRRWAFFLRKGEQQTPTILFHRWGGELFRYSNRARAEALTGSSLFDALRDEWSSEQRDALKARYETAAAAVGYEPVLRVVF
ncbi:MAG: hypothetical protein HY901_11105 [Deltaproteobacteria bacterium]|nr:hypothetical protein [Deltaproteobacteria bacterium]